MSENLPSSFQRVTVSFRGAACEFLVRDVEEGEDLEEHFLRVVEVEEVGDEDSHAPLLRLSWSGSTAELTPARTRAGEDLVHEFLVEAEVTSTPV